MRKHRNNRQGECAINIAYTPRGAGHGKRSKVDLTSAARLSLLSVSLS